MAPLAQRFFAAEIGINWRSRGDGFAVISPGLDWNSPGWFSGWLSRLVFPVGFPASH
jgi:hypothetical protein